MSLLVLWQNFIVRVGLRFCFHQEFQILIAVPFSQTRMQSYNIFQPYASILQKYFEKIVLFFENTMKFSQIN